MRIINSAEVEEETRQAGEGDHRIIQAIEGEINNVFCRLRKNEKIGYESNLSRC